ncbi:PepSY-associated TM helix domain-containing protein [Flagellimonas myxillae]|uniref:PepSY-associated TM helix domain-containing protein n=1 Tax=Flagellimonas myxillae TaxID=2942214 RepID=UPI00201F0C46|nr:PepSY-associated TM helix domain-containing protein [Muricauda myxillae]MCL6265157.1 PepSY-associated TM helix domain-containing protein [Muricauda myxillae]
MYKFTNRNLHRDFAYFYVGLIIAFSFSGIILNHRQDWYPMDYTFESEEVSLALEAKTTDFSKEQIEDFSKDWDVEYDSHRVRDNSLRVYYKDNVILDADLKTGKGVLEYKRKVPFIGHTMFLHKSTNSFWIWYSDIFGAAMLLIAITGILIPNGKNGFKSRGWKFAVAGILFPLLFLILYS